MIKGKVMKLMPKPQIEAGDWSKVFARIATTIAQWNVSDGACLVCTTEEVVTSLCEAIAAILVSVPLDLREGLLDEIPDFLDGMIPVLREAINEAGGEHSALYGALPSWKGLANECQSYADRLRQEVK